MAEMNGLGKYILTGVLYQWFLAFIVLGSMFFFGDKGVLFEFDFIVWDAEHMEIIKDKGYDFPRSAFFPLFPFFWKFSQLGAIGISVLNSVLFGAAMGWLCYFLRFTWIQVLICLSVPSLLFMSLPYAEALMFLFGVGYLVAMRKEKLVFEMFFLFLISLCKPTAAIFLPTVILAETLFRQNNKISWVRMLLTIFVILSGTGTALWIQWSDTHEWNGFFQAQKSWGNYFRLPRFPLDTWNHPEVIWLDFSAFIISSVAAVVLLVIILKRQFKYSYDRTFVYSLLYLFGTTAYVVLFRGGDLFSLNRFVFAAPFVYFVLGGLVPFFNSISYNKLLLVITLLGVLLSLFFGSYLHIRSLLGYTAIAFLIASILGSFHKSYRKSIAILSLIALCFFACYYRYTIICGHWVA
jgi:hypothetical protein